MSNKIKTIRIDIVDDGGEKKWLVELSIPRSFPLRLVDHRPWERFPRREPPVRKFIGKGMCWGEITDSGFMAVGGLYDKLNAIVSRYAADTYRI